MKDFPPYLSAYEFDTRVFTFVALAALFVFIRLYCRFYLVKARGLDDALAVLALVFFILGAVFCHEQTSYNRKIYYAFDPSNGVSFKEYKYYDTVAFRYSCLTFTAGCLNSGLIKSSILVFYLRIVSTRKARWTIYAIIGAVVVGTTLSVLVVWLDFRPIPAVWNVWDYPNATVVIDILTFNTLSSSLQLAYDIAIIIIPIPVIRKLKIPRSKKVGIALIYSTGFVSLAVTVRSLVSFIESHFGENTDSPRVVISESAWSLIWGVVEGSTAIMCACMPAMAPLFRICIERGSVLLTTFQNLITSRSITIASFRAAVRTGSEPGESWSPSSPSGKKPDVEAVSLPSSL